MLLKDLTEDQCIEIAKIVYSHDIGIKSDFNVVYQRYDWRMYENARELQKIFFKAVIFGESIYPVIVEIDADLDCWIYYIKPKDGTDHSHTLPTQNQYYVQKKFREWGIYPDLMEQREGEIDKVL